jgi:hypothetical protein
VLKAQFRDSLTIRRLIAAHGLHKFGPAIAEGGNEKQVFKAKAN